MGGGGVVAAIESLKTQCSVNILRKELGVRKSFLCRMYVLFVCVCPRFSGLQLCCRTCCDRLYPLLAGKLVDNDDDWMGDRRKQIRSDAQRHHALNEFVVYPGAIPPPKSSDRVII